MAEELQGLLERIHKEGIQKADKEKNEILSQAKKEADSIIKKAKEEAESILKKAGEKAQKEEEKAKASIQQAARDIIITLKSELLERLNHCVKNITSEAMTPKQMSEIISKMADSFAKNSGKDAELTLILPAKDLDKIADQFKANLANNLKSQPEILKSSDFSAGLQIGFKGNDVFFDFSDEALSEIISNYVGPKLASILNSK